MNLEMTEKRLLKILIHGTDKELAEIIEDIHPADILDAIHENENEVGKILNRLPEWMIAAVIEEEDDDEEKYKLLKKFPESKQKKILNEMSSDEITDLIGVLDDKESEAV